MSFFRRLYAAHNAGALDMSEYLAFALLRLAQIELAEHPLGQNPPRVLDFFGRDVRVIGGAQMMVAVLATVSFGPLAELVKPIAGAARIADDLERASVIVSVERMATNACSPRRDASSITAPDTPAP
jgi:hypothetical protein